MPTIEGPKLDLSQIRFGLVAAEFNDFVVQHLVRGAEAYLEQQGVPSLSITKVRVPGCYEIPLMCQLLASSGEFEALVALGAVIRGATTHYEHVARAAIDGCAHVMLHHEIPIGLGILTTENVEQAMERASSHNRGREAAQTALTMLKLKRGVSEHLKAPK